MDERWTNFETNLWISFRDRDVHFWGVSKKVFTIRKWKILNNPLAKIFQFFNFVPNCSNCNPPNFCALKMSFERERAKKLKNSLFKILRQSPTLIHKMKNYFWGFRFCLSPTACKLFTFLSNFSILHSILVSCKIDPSDQKMTFQNHTPPTFTVLNDF